MYGPGSRCRAITDGASRSGSEPSWGTNFARSHRSDIGGQHVFARTRPRHPAQLRLPGPGEPARRPGSGQTATSVASQLGATISPSQPGEFTVGTSITRVLADPAKLAALGAEGMHAGARVTAARTAMERVHVEVDELEPAPLTKRLTLKIDAQGRLTRITQ